MPRNATLFISHGAPNLVLYDTPARRFFDRLGTQLSRPRAICVASAHYAAAAPALTAAAAPRTIHDFSGFEPELYAMHYPAPGAPAIAATIAELIRRGMGIEPTLDAERGFDHGVWNPLLRIYPAGDIPVVALSINPAQGPEWHCRLGRSLRPLLDDDILLIGSGAINHNLARLQRQAGNQAPPEWVTRFLDWCTCALESGDESTLLDYANRAPHAADNHPTVEHLLPLYVAMGAAGAGWRGQRLHHSISFGTLAMDAWAFQVAGS